MLNPKLSHCFIRQMLTVAWIIHSLTLGYGAQKLYVGVAKVDITPDYPIRLTGFVARKIPSTGVEQRLWAKAIAIGSDSQGPRMIITVDNCGICANIIEVVAEKLANRFRIKRDRLAVCSSHTHAGPQTLGFAPNIFAMDLPRDQNEAISRYTTELASKLENVAAEALANRKPANLSWDKTEASFAANRRTKGGPSYHQVPFMKIEGENNNIQGILANYACHCTTVGAEVTKTCGDWAGFAQEALEKAFPGSIGLIAIGCGADSNPFPRGGPDGGIAFARQHGENLASNIVERIKLSRMNSLSHLPTCRMERFQLPFGKAFTTQDWEARASQNGIVGYHAKRYLQLIAKGKKIPMSIPYSVQTWAFGKELAMVFLPGEVVVDYVLRLNRELDESKLWVNAYANDVPCYIPSQRILQEGGYEAVDSLWYYDQPAQISTNAEDLIIGKVHKILPRSFKSNANKSKFSPKGK